MPSSRPPGVQNEQVKAQDWQTAALNLSSKLHHLLSQHLPSKDRHNQSALLAEAERISSFRRLRDRMMEGAGGTDLLREPAWDMLLDLYIAKARNRNISVSSLCRAARVPDTTGLRWIAQLARHDFVERRADPMDGRRTFMVLTPKAVDTPGQPDECRPLVDASRLARQIAAEFLPLADKTGRTVTVDAEFAAPVNVPDLDEALRNLVSNALHHGQGTVSLSVSATGEEIVITVQDEGTGVPEVERIRMLSRFAKGEHSPGSGLGLAIASAVIERSGGRLTWPMPSTLQLHMLGCSFAADGDG